METESGFVPTESILEAEIIDRIPLVGLVGAPASGKGTVAGILKDKFKFAHTAFSQSIKDHATLMHGFSEPIPRDMMKQIGFNMRDYYGEESNFNRVTRKALFQLEQDPTLQGAVLDGTRWESEAKKLSEMKNCLLVWVDAPVEVRRMRLLERARPGDYADDFEASDAAELEWIAPIKPYASIILENDGTLEDLENKVFEIMQREFGLSPQV